MEEHSENEIRIKRSVLWKTYFCFMVYLSVMVVNDGLDVIKPWIIVYRGLGLIKFIDIPMTLIATIGLFGYVFNKRIYKQSFWICFFGFYLANNLVTPLETPVIEAVPRFISEFLDYDPELSDTGNKIGAISGVVFLNTLLLPTHIALLLYALPSNKLWKKIER